MWAVKFEQQSDCAGVVLAAVRRFAWPGAAAAGLLLTAACGDDEGPTLLSDSTVVVSVVPDTVNLQPGQSRQLVAVITGTTNQGAIWSSSDTAVASVSVGGLVTAGSTTGAAVITAIALADDRARDVARVSVFRPALAGRPAIVIRTINMAGTPNAIDAGNVRGSIDVITQIDIPGGVAVKRVEISVDSAIIPECTRNLEGAGAPPAGSGAQLLLPCSLNTAAYDTLTGDSRLTNGSRVIVARAILSNDSVGATAGRDVQLNNPSFLLARVTTSRASALSAASPRSIGGTGLAWHAGSITVKVLPVLFTRTAPDSVSEVAVTLATSGAGVSGVAGCVPTGVAASGVGSARQDPTIALADGGAGQPGDNAGSTPNCVRAVATRRDSDGSDGFVITFPDSVDLTRAGVAGVEDSVTLAIHSTLKSGQAGPACINPGPDNPLWGASDGANCGSGAGSSSPAYRVPLGGPWRLDNLAPRFTSLNIRRQGVEPYFNSQSFVAQAVLADSDSILGAFTADYGAGGQADSPNTIFRAGHAFNAMNPFSNTSTLSEASERYYFQAVVKDALGNTRIGTATNTRFVVADGQGNAPPGSNSQAQLFGVDFTKPQIVVHAATPADKSFIGNSVTPGTFRLEAEDPGVGPSNFSLTPFRVRAELINGSGSACYNLEAGGTLSCSSNGGTFLSDGVFDLAAGVNGYWHVTWVLSDRARNETAAETRIRLVDGTFPTVGSISGPSVLSGGQNASFSAQLTDNVELKDVVASLSYLENGFNFAIDEAITGLETYGTEPLVAQTSANTTISSFLRSIEGSSAGLPTGIVSRATHFTYWVRDQLDNSTSQAVGILPAVMAGIGGAGTETSWRGAGRAFAAAVNPVGSYQITTSPADICVDTDNDGCSTATSRTLTVTATGPALTFANPFARVVFYSRNPDTGRLVLIGVGAASFRDDGGSNTRTWTYATSFSAPPGFSSGAVHNVVAIGIDLAGRGLASGFLALRQVPD